jgi:hypothetical protein
MPLSSSPIRHPLAKGADAIQAIHFKQVSRHSPFPVGSVGSTVDNFFPIVVFYSLGALIGCYAPVG